MATLYERLSGNNLGEDGSEKIGIHAFLAAVFEYRRGHLTESEVQAMFNLTPSQVTDGNAFFAMLGLAPNQDRMMRVVKDWIYLAEAKAAPQYVDSANLFARMQQEIIDQGGTIPNG